VIGVVIDKRKLKDRYTNPYNPYHIGIQYGLERVRQYLRMKTSSTRRSNARRSD
jgi:hypothetical protein